MMRGRETFSLFLGVKEITRPAIVVDLTERSGTGTKRRAGMMAFTELASSDPARTRRFLERAFNWKFDSVQMPMGEYLTSETPQGMTVGIRPTRPKEPPISTNYVLVDDLEDAEKKVRDLDGEIVLPKTDIPGMGKFFWFKIPNGPVMACWQDATEMGRRTNRYTTGQDEE